MKNKILIDKFRLSDLILEKKILGSKYEIITLNNEDIKNSRNILKDIDGVLAWHENNYDKKVLNDLSKCKIIVRVGVGFNNVDINYAKNKKIAVCNVPDYGINDVADHTMTLILMLLKKINMYSEKVKKKLDWSWGNHNKLKRIQECTLGILGCGRIGSSVALRAKSFGMKIVIFDPFLSPGYEKTLGVKREFGLKKFLKQLDVLSIHAPLTNITKNMVNDDFLSNMKKKSILINTARGQIVEKSSIYKFLKKGHLSGVGFDVYPDEPPSQNDKLYIAWKNNNLNFQDNIIFTPHCAFLNKQSFIELREKAAFTIKDFFEKNIILNKVN